MSPQPPPPPANSSLDCPLSSFEQGSVRDAVELEFQMALSEEKMKRGMHVSDACAQELRTTVMPNVFLTFLELRGAQQSEALSAGERSMLRDQMTAYLQRELER